MNKNQKTIDSKILVTGYGAFLDHTDNPSLRVARAMHEMSEVCDCRELPVEFSKLDSALNEINLHQYEWIFLIGLAGARDLVTPEKVALNWCYSPGRPDNEGKTFEKGVELVKNSAAALFSTMAVEELTQDLNNKGILSQISFSAGTYVCNATYYKVLQRLEETSSKVVFIHIPKDVNINKLAQALLDFAGL